MILKIYPLFPDYSNKHQTKPYLSENLHLNCIALDEYQMYLFTGSVEYLRSFMVYEKNATAEPPPQFEFFNES